MTTPPSSSKRSESHPQLIGVSAGVILFALTLFTVGMFFLPTLGAQWVSATQPGPSWTPPPPTVAPTITPAPTATPPPTATTSSSTPATQATPTGALAFKIGDMVTNVNKGVVNLRRTPGYLGKANSDRTGLVASGQPLRIIGGPAQKDELVWWQVQWGDKAGWMAERTASGVLILKLAE